MVTACSGGMVEDPKCPDVETIAGRPEDPAEPLTVTIQVASR
jgi:hypothetical protein